MPFSSTVRTASPPTSAFDGGRTGGWGLYTSSGPKSPMQDNLKGKFMSVCCHNANVMQGQHRSLDSDRTGGEVHALHEDEEVAGAGIKQFYTSPIYRHMYMCTYLYILPNRVVP